MEPEDRIIESATWGFENTIVPAAKWEKCVIYLDDGPIMLRPMSAEDGQFPDDKKIVVKSWLYGFKGSYYAGPIQDNLYYRVYQEVIDRLLTRDDIMVTMAVLPEKPDEVVGYIVIENGFEFPCVHWIYVKKDQRGRGVGTAILQAHGVMPETKFFYTFRTYSTPSLIANLQLTGIFRPKCVSQKKRRTK